MSNLNFFSYKKKKVWYVRHNTREPIQNTGNSLTVGAVVARTFRIWGQSDFGRTVSKNLKIGTSSDCRTIFLQNSPFSYRKQEKLQLLQFNFSIFFALPPSPKVKQLWFSETFSVYFRHHLEKAEIFLEISCVKLEIKKKRVEAFDFGNVSLH